MVRPSGTQQSFTLTMNNQYTPHIHHRRSIRLKGYDYSQAGLYFITICCAARQCLFGNIADKTLQLNQGGVIAQECWVEIPHHFPNVVLHEYIVMPNHVHGIIEIVFDANTVGAKNFSPPPPTDTDIHTSGITAKNFSPQFTSPSKTIGSIVRGYKIGVTKWFRQNTDIHEVWQRNYYEHIIRNEEAYRRIAEYIKHNPAQWQEDQLYNDLSK
jgi:REP element-mobilizing transposase RayT